VFSRLDYCNSLLYDDGVSEGLLGHVRTPPRDLLTGARRRDHITPILRQLHWLPVRHRVQFKVAVLVFQCLSGNAPTYLADDCQLIADVSLHRLRLIDTAMCAVRGPHNTFGD